MSDHWSAVERRIAGLLAEVTGIDAATFAAQAPFDELGIDSITINQFNAALARHVRGVPRTLLFDCRCLGDVCDWLGRHHRAALLAAFAPTQAPEVPAPQAARPVGAANGSPVPDGVQTFANDRAGAPAASTTPATATAADWPVLRSRAAAPRAGAAALRATDSAPRKAAARLSSTPSTDDIAIVGMAGRYPDAGDVAAFWRNLEAGRNSVREVPAARWSLDGFWEPGETAGARGRSYCKWGAFLDDVNGFDADFFGIAPREAETMDPQERIFLEVAWQALEDAGLALLRQRADARDGLPVSVYVGVTTQTHQLAGPALWQRGQPVFPTSLAWSVANRVSFLLNLRGASLPVDTACSASLSALHLACEGLRRGEAEMALVGGVNLYLHPSKFVWLSQQRMLTATGQCHAFSDDADGFVPGEGAGAIVLKPLGAALRDGNRILGLVRATGVNHGGRANGYTVPTPAAQAALIRATFERGDVSPASIGYVEAHGTGTRLGDPVEIDGLARAFAEAAEARGEAPPPAANCAIASTKTNIGHLESAAGIAGLTRILLQLEARRFAPLLNFRALNPNIDLGRTPFRLQTEAADWPAPADGGPRRAAISSFGAGGANAHAVIEEWLPATGLETFADSGRAGTRAGAHAGPEAAAAGPEAGTAPPLALFPLSARTPAALAARTAQLLAEIDAGRITDRQLAALARTLQQAREPLPARIVIAARDCAGLRAALAAPPAATVVRRPLPGAALAAPASADEVAAAWLEGRAIDWASWWGERRPTLLALPPYPFEHQDCSLARHAAAAPAPAFAWSGLDPITAGAGMTDGPRALTGTTPGMALGATSPDSSASASAPAARFDLVAPGTVAITPAPDAFFLADHPIHGEPVLPATGWLELARAAAGIALGRPVGAIHNAGFGRPWRAGRDGAITLHLDAPDASGAASFELRSQPADGGAPLMHARGRAEPLAASAGKLARGLREAGGLRDAAGATPGANAADGATATDSSPTTRPADHLDHATIYRRFADCGFGYGPAFSALQTLAVHDGGVSASLALAPVDWQRAAGCAWHPGLLDACLQAVVPLLQRHGAPATTTYVPFAIGALDIAGDLRHARRLVLRPRAPARAAGVAHHDAWLLDDGDAVVAAMRDIVLRPLDATAGAPAGSTSTAAQPAGHSDAAPDRLRWLQPRWRDRPLAAETLATTRAPRLAGPADARWQSAFDAALRAATAQTATPQPTAAATATQADATHPAPLIVLDALLAAPAADLATARRHGLEALWRHARDAMRAAAGKPLRIVFGWRDDGSLAADAHAAAIGFARSLHRENPATLVRLVALAPALADAPERAAAALLAEARVTADRPALLRLHADGRREIETLAVLPGSDAPPATAPAALPARFVRDGAVYLVTGGAGGLGLDFARRLAASARGITLVLCGRSAADERIESALDGLRALGARALYRAADLADPTAVRLLVADCRAHGPVAGVLHAAGVLRDAFVLRKDLADIDATCRPKMEAVVALDAELAADRLDWFVLYSSLAGVLGNVGQADYAAANAFMDRWAARRNAEARAGRRHGAALAIAWPLWHDGGMQVDDATRERHRALGIATVGRADGAVMFDLALAAALDGRADGCVFPLRVRADAEPALLAAEGPLAGQFAGQPAPAAQAAPVAPTARTAHTAQPTTAHPTTAVTAAATATTDPATLRPALLAHLRDLLARTTGRAADRLDSGVSFPDLGLDSVMVMELNAALDVDFRDLSRTLFFECDNLDEVADRLLADHAGDVARRFGAPVAAQAPAPACIATAAAPTTAQSASTAHFPPATTPAAPADASPPAPQPQPVTSVVNTPAATDIAIIGIAGRYPGADSLDAFWTLLADGVDAVTEVPPERWALPPADATAGRAKRGDYARWGSFLDGVDRFDPLFFGIAPREAERMDPQERLFLETAWHAVENAGHTPASLQQPCAGDARQRIGVYAGVMYSEYQFLGVEAMARGERGLGMSSFASIANRVSYCLDFDGPSMAVDTMCSSSLSAIHLACEAIRAGSCDAAIAGGVNLSLHPYKYRTLSELKFASTDGRCRSFGAGGDGYVPGEGVGAVVLKPLARALADGDRVLAVIKGSAVNHGGRTNGYTVPNPKAQGRLVGDALARAGVDPRAVNYIEAHGTGTPLGDPIEVSGLVQAFAGAEGQCAIGSLKSNLGHLESAAGIAALTKVLLQLEHRTLAPTLHADPPNPGIRFAGTRFHVQTALAHWPAPLAADGTALPRCAGISSFGAGGSNAHLVLEEAPPLPAPPARAEGEARLFVFSAGDAAGLRAQAADFADWLRADPTTPELDAAALVLRAGRIARPERLAIVAANGIALLAALDGWLARADHAADRLRTPSPDLSAVLAATTDIATGRAPDGRRADASLPADIAGLDAAALADAAGAWVEGRLDWSRPRAPFVRVALPGTRFARRRCWIETTPDVGAPSVTASPQAAPAPATAATTHMPPAMPAPATTQAGPATAPATPAEILAEVRAGRLGMAEATALLQRLASRAGVTA
ncbi:SDR family NAD(P)-dependent oxidoreductase [Derxia gummosa]|uniref:SDR family NAD(P)-dependent oxidoreductase n=1 Tax=Derxia gummosa DSM 723 TaxID=1121388 RepID=A0A8B6X7G3_9BURK|nr:SDR family NAD(P)-dependent oxidoreductase [Derxia gummosa]